LSEMIAGLKGRVAYFETQIYTVLLLIIIKV